MKILFVFLFGGLKIGVRLIRLCSYLPGILAAQSYQESNLPVDRVDMRVKSEYIFSLLSESDRIGLAILSLKMEIPLLEELKRKI